MKEKTYEYHGLVASSWDFARGDTSEFTDRAYYRNFVATSGPPILVVGCGTGRLVFDFLQDGWETDGLDVSPEMLAICEEKAERLGLELNLYRQPMEAMELPRRYQTIVVPSMAFQLVTNLEDAISTLSHLYRHLLPGGKLGMVLWHIQKEGQPDWGDWWVVYDKEGYQPGRRLKRSERSHYDGETRLRHTENLYEVIEGDEVIYSELHRRSPELRNYTPDEVFHMLESAGFGQINLYKEFSNQPAADDDSIVSIEAFRPTR